MIKRIQWKDSNVLGNLELDFTKPDGTAYGGKDLIILSNSILGELMIYAECKRYSQKHPVNVGLVRELYGTIEADKATAGIMVTTSYFSKDARKFQEKISGRMNFIDYSELIRQILECS